MTDTPRNFYGRRHGKTLKPAQRQWLSEDLPRLALPMDGQLDPAVLFGRRPVWLEIGFGSGEHLAHQAALHPGVGFIGAEPFVNGVATCLGKLRQAGVSNVRILKGDVRDLLDRIAPASLAKVFLLYPDPWPKARHHRRRFVTPDHLHPLARAMAPGAELRIATDIPDYVRQTLEEVPATKFRWTARRAADWRIPWDDWTRTRYEAKAVREGRTPHYLTFRREG